jgi:ABC-type Fe3+ transport system substrate-binding protein
MKEILFNPEVLDESLWFEGHFWADPAEQNRVFAFGGSASGAEIAYNTNLVNPADIDSYWDLLDPKYDGKIVARDPRIAGTSQSTALYYQLMGKDFLEQLLKKIIIVEDARQAAEQLALGTYSICLFACTQEVQAAREDGLPVSEEWPGQVEEGSRISTGANTLVAMDHPKNPNAQKLFINWFLGKEGQIWWQKITEEQSLRTDIPIDAVAETSRRDPNKQYLLFERDPNFQTKLEESLEFARQVLASTGQ